MEKATLHELNQLEEMPSEKPWQMVCEELDRNRVGAILRQEEAHPSETVWHSIEKKLKTSNTRKRMLIAAAVLVFIIGTLQMWQPGDSDETMKKMETEVTRPITIPKPLEISPTMERATTPTDPIIVIEDKEVDQVQQKTNNRTITEPLSESTYLWVANTKGEPMRLSVRWEDLSCCISGEAQSVECDQQRNEWTTELLRSDLGHHADPVLGLMALLKTSE